MSEDRERVIRRIWDEWRDNEPMTVIMARAYDAGLEAGLTAGLDAAAEVVDAQLFHDLPDEVAARIRALKPGPVADVIPFTGNSR